MEAINENHPNDVHNNIENEGNASTGSQNGQNEKKRKRRSNVWQHFSSQYEGTGNDKTEFAKCNHCPK